MRVLNSLLFVAFTVLMTSNPVYAKTKFPSFNLEKDMLTLVETALFFSNEERPVQFKGKKYTLKINGGILTPLLKGLTFGLIIDRLPTTQRNKKGVKPFLEVYSDGLKNKNQSFELDDYIDAIQKVMPQDTLTIAQDQVFIAELITRAKETKLARPDLYAALTNLTDLENRENLITKTELSADGLTQTYKLDLGTTFVLFTLKKV